MRLLRVGDPGVEFPSVLDESGRDVLAGPPAQRHSIGQA